MSWGSSADEMRRALKATVVPELRARGFKGSFPHFSRLRAERMDLLTFQFSQYGPDLYIEIASCGRDGITQPDGSYIPAAKARTYHVGAPRRRIGPQPSLDFGGAQSHAEALELVKRVSEAISGEGEAWWLNS